MRYTELRQLNLVWCTDFSAWKGMKSTENKNILKWHNTEICKFLRNTPDVLHIPVLDIVERQVYLGILRHLWPPRNPFSSWSQNYNQTGIFAEMGWAKCFISHAKQGSAGDIWILPCVSRAALQKRCIISQLLALPLLLWYFKRM